MPKPHAKNERIKRKYLQWLEVAKGASTVTADKAAASIAAFEKSTKGRDFAAFHIEQPQKFQRDLNDAVHPKSGKPLAKGTIRSKLMDVKAFFKWLADQQGYKSRISHADCEYFNMTANDTRIATARREQPIPSREIIDHVLAKAPFETPLEKRDRALVAFTLLSGMRDAAIASLPLGKVNVERREIFQDARFVGTKNAKTAMTFFFPIGGDALSIVTDWIKHLRKVELFADTDPLFPKTEVRPNGEGVFASHLGRGYWTSAAPIRRVFREQFEAAGQPYYPPHSFRKILMQIAFKRRLHPEALKAWSQNLMHDNLATSLNSYGKVTDWRTAEILEELAVESEMKLDVEDPPRELLQWLEQMAKKKRS